MDQLREDILNAETVFAGRYVTVEVRTVRLPDGHRATREIVSPPNAVGVLALDRDGGVHLVRQFRSALGRAILEIPAGIIDRGESAEQTGRRECEEETGMIPGRLTRLCRFYHSVGFSTGHIELYRATDLSPSDNRHAEAGEVIERVVLPFETLQGMVEAGEIVDSKTIIAVLWHLRSLDSADKSPLP
ncbi:MAG TPA: NUDIX hydrolase [Nitrospiria bacterium]|nr:NUDIX hydrolase [Nitrospiria bacterium]